MRFESDGLSVFNARIVENVYQSKVIPCDNDVLAEIRVDRINVGSI